MGLVVSLITISAGYYTYDRFIDSQKSISSVDEISNKQSTTSQNDFTPDLKKLRRNKIGETLPKRKSPYSEPKIINKQIKVTPNAKPIQELEVVEVKKIAKTTTSSVKEYVDNSKVRAIELVTSPSLPDRKPVLVTTTSKETYVHPLVTLGENNPLLAKYAYSIYVDARSAHKGKEIKGDITVYDDKRLKKITEIKTHTLAGINDPKNGDQSIRLASSIFGYRPQLISFSLANPKDATPVNNSSVEAINDSIIKINLTLERLQVGDIAVMWKVYFFRDAAIMLPESKNELEDLVSMMIENSNMRIRLHGHTNGNSHGKIIHLGKDDNDDLFDINSEKHIKTVGSAQKLSLYRAETIQHYLMEQGIKESRIEIKGWGGKKMLHDKHDDQAKFNVRVEVEILDN